MNTTEVPDKLQPPPTYSEQHPLPEPSTALQDEPQSPAVSHNEPGSVATKTVLQIEPNEQRLDAPETRDTREETHQGASESIPIEKIVTISVTGILSLFTIAIAYAAPLSHSVIANPIGPLVVSVILTVFNIITFAWISTRKYRVTTTGALLPIFFSFIGGLMMILFFAAIEAAKRGRLIHLNITAVLISFGVFGGIGTGANMGYCAFARN